MIPTAGVFVSCINLQTTLLYKQVYSFLSVTFTIIAVDSGNTVQCTDFVHTCFPLRNKYVQLYVHAILYCSIYKRKQKTYSLCVFVSSKNLFLQQWNNFCCEGHYYRNFRKRHDKLSNISSLYIIYLCTTVMFVAQVCKINIVLQYSNWKQDFLHFHINNFRQKFSTFLKFWTLFLNFKAYCSLFKRQILKGQYWYVVK